MATVVHRILGEDQDFENFSEWTKLLDPQVTKEFLISLGFPNPEEVEALFVSDWLEADEMRKDRFEYVWNAINLRQEDGKTPLVRYFDFVGEQVLSHPEIPEFNHNFHREELILLMAFGIVCEKYKVCNQIAPAFRKEILRYLRSNNYWGLSWRS